MYIFVGKKFSTNNRYLEFQVLIRLCMCSCRSKYARRIYIITPIKPFSQWDLSPKRDLFTYLHSVRHQRVQYLFMCEKSFVYCYCLLSSIWYVYCRSIVHIGVCHSYCSFPLVIKIWKWSFFFTFFLLFHMSSNILA